MLPEEYQNGKEAVDLLTEKDYFSRSGKKQSD